MKKFNKLFKNVMNTLGEEDDIDDSIFYLENGFDGYDGDEYEKFKAKLNEELDKVKIADNRLKVLSLNFDVALTETYDGVVPAYYEPNFKNEIFINPSIFVKNLMSYNYDFKTAVFPYIYKTDGIVEHILQHECAHFLDYLENGDRGIENVHDLTFRKIQKKLNEKTHLDD